MKDDVFLPSFNELRKHYEIVGSGNVMIVKNIFLRIHGVWHIIPRGFVSDGGSLPSVVSSITGIDPYDYRIVLFSIYHDYLYRCQFTSRFYADAFYKSGLELTAGKLIASLFYQGLRAFGWIAWAKNKRKGLETFALAKTDLIIFNCELSGLKK